MIGPYELHDFSLYHVLRFGYPPAKVAFLAYCAWHDARRGGWPDIPPEHRHQYAIGEIKDHLRTFLFRFFQTSQFKRSAHSQRAQGRFGRLALAARRLARALGQRGRGLARGARPRPRPRVAPDARLHRYPNR